MTHQPGRSGVRKSSCLAARSVTNTKRTATTTAAVATPKTPPPTCDYCKALFKGPFKHRPAACKRFFLECHRANEDRVKTACKLSIRQNRCHLGDLSREIVDLNLQNFKLFSIRFAQLSEWRAQDHEQYLDYEYLLLGFFSYQNLVGLGKIDPRTSVLPAPPPGALPDEYLYGELDLGPQGSIVYFGPFEAPTRARDFNGDPVEFQVAIPGDPARQPSHISIRLFSQGLITVKMPTQVVLTMLPNVAPAAISNPQEFEFWGCNGGLMGRVLFGDAEEV